MASWKTVGISIMVLILFIIPVTCLFFLLHSQEVNHQFYPDINQDYIIWEEKKQDDIDIKGYCRSTGEEICITGEGNQLSPALYKTMVVWMEKKSPGFWQRIFRKIQNKNTWDIYGYDFSTQKKIDIATGDGDQKFPAIYENIVVWQDNSQGEWDIYGYNLLDNQTFRIATHAGDQCSPAIYENIVIWEDNREGNWDIYGYNFETSQEFSITTHVYDQRSPAIYDNCVVWMDNRNYNWDIYCYFLSGEMEFPLTQKDRQKESELNSNPRIFPITTNGNDQRSPKIHNNIIVWADNRNEGTTAWDIYGFTLDSPHEFYITRTQCNEKYPAVYTDTAVWMYHQKGKWTICSTSLSDKDLPTKGSGHDEQNPCKESFPFYERSLYILSVVLLPSAAIVTAYIYTDIYTKNNEPHKLKTEKPIQINALKDPLSKFFLKEWKFFIIIFFLFFLLLVLANVFSHSMREIDIDSLSREDVVFLVEEVRTRSVFQGPPFFFLFLVPLLFLYPARRFFLYIPQAYKELQIAIKKGEHSESTYADIETQKKQLNKSLNGINTYTVGIIFVFYKILGRLPEVQLRNVYFVSWDSFVFFPVNAVLSIVLEMIIWFMAGVFIGKVVWIVYDMWKVSNTYSMELNPYHPDGSGGFGFLKELWIKMIQMAIPILILPLLLFLSTYCFGTHFSRSFTSIGYSGVIVCLLLVQVFIYYRIVNTQKKHFLKGMEDHINTYQKEMKQILDNKGDLDHCIKQLENIQTIVSQVKSISSWPFKGSENIYILLSAMLPLFPYIIDYIF
ncbi:MAG: hypothetical protein PVF58_11525 [Candidatus Methanofastidiosia archaeon]|jgi:beta propeller repeat protein